MFSGIVSEIGRVVMVRGGAGATELGIACRLAGEDLAVGESVAVSGTCLTVVGGDGESFQATASLETLGCTTLGRLAVGHAVNLERALRASDRLGGHFVQGHVDGVGRVSSVRPAGVARVVAIESPAMLVPHLVDRGSVAVDGVSLTITSVDASRFEVTLIPATLAATTLGGLRAGATVNLEADILSKYVAAAMAARGGLAATRPGPTAVDWLAAGEES
ncbi:MAG: riboflavin synthase [Acidobacteriota bacterium]